MNVPLYWATPYIDEKNLWAFLAAIFQFQRKNYIVHVVPTLVVRSLLDVASGQGRNLPGYEMQSKLTRRDNSLAKVKYLLSAGTTLDMSQWSKMEGGLCNADERVDCETLEWIIRRTVPDSMAIPARKAKSKAKTTSLSEAGNGTSAPKKRCRPRKETEDVEAGSSRKRRKIGIPPADSLQQTCHVSKEIDRPVRLFVDQTAYSDEDAETDDVPLVEVQKPFFVDLTGDSDTDDSKDSDDIPRFSSIDRSLGNVHDQEIDIPRLAQLAKTLENEDGDIPSFKFSPP
jgi:hypothetical protein